MEHRKKNVMMTAVNKIIEHIARISKKMGYWAITADEVMEITQLEPYKFKRYLEQARITVNMPKHMNIFSNDNPGDLITLLECIYGKNKDMEKLFSEKGIFINYENMIELNDLLINSANEIMSKHEINENMFQEILNETKSFEEAKDIYLNEEFNIDEIIEKTCLSYVSLNKFQLDKLAKRNTLKYLNSLFERKILNKNTVLSNVVYKLKQYAIKIHFYQEESDDYSSNYYYEDKNNVNQGNEGQKHLKKPSRKEIAKSILGIKGEFDINILRKKYRNMMKIYHPDINPQGLQKSQEINAAYSVLLEELK